MADLKNMNAGELRQALHNYFGTQESQVPGPPVPPGVTLSAEQAQNVSDFWITSILAKDHHTWTEIERNAVRTACVRAAKER